MSASEPKRTLAAAPPAMHGSEPTPHPAILAQNPGLAEKPIRRRKLITRVGGAGRGPIVPKSPKRRTIEFLATDANNGTAWTAPFAARSRNLGGPEGRP